MTNNISEINIKGIMDLIPHRYPFLLVDRIIEINPSKTIIGIKNVTINEPQFTGHFPTQPVMPGVLIIESLAQVSAILIAQSMNNVEEKEVLFMSIESTKFRRVVEPGDQMILKSTILQHRSHVWKFEAKAEVGGNIAAESVFTAMVRNKQ